MKRVLSAALVMSLLGFGLSGCGADGEPVQPSLNAGVGIGPGGITPRLGLNLSKGPFGLNLGL